jgi:hypothetical protein
VQWARFTSRIIFIDVRRLLAKSGSPSRKHLMHGLHWHQLCSSTLQRHELWLDRGWPPAFDGCDRPPSLLTKERARSTSPQRPHAEGQASTTGPQPIAGAMGTR